MPHVAITPVPCKVCAGEWPGKEQKIADLELSSAYLFEDQFFPGWTVLVLKRHATELFELTKDERSQLIEDVSAVATALAMTFEPVKLNYELLGNQTPHIHWHVIPRLLDDPAPKEPVWRVPHEPIRLTQDALRERIVLVRGYLK
jgi:diadenosine tetraphosphate (Ap4A) HIT family hydrolase